MTARALQVEHIFIILIAAGQPAFFLPFFCLLCYLLCCLCFALILPSSNRSDLPCFCLYLFHLPFRLPLFCLIFKYCWPPSVYWKSLITVVETWSRQCSMSGQGVHVVPCLNHRGFSQRVRSTNKGSLKCPLRVSIRVL